MKILITGGLGFVGIHLVRFMAEKGADVIATDIAVPDARIQAFLNPVKSRVKIKSLDVRQRAAFETLVQEENVDSIIHAAAVTPDFITEKTRMETILDANLGGSLNAILITSKIQCVQNLILCSSSGLYGAAPPPEAPLQHESDPLDLDNLYAITKYSAELLGQRCGLLSGKRITSVRLASIYGEMEYPNASRETMSHIGRLWQARNSSKKVLVTGKKVERDWMYAGDLAEAVWGLLEAPKWHYPVYNIGTAGVISFETIVEIFSRFGLGYEWEEDPGKADIAMRPDQARAPMDISRLKEDANFSFGSDPQKSLEQYLFKKTSQFG